MLHRRLSGAPGEPGVAVVALAGLGGVGKTTIAPECAHRHLDDFPVVWQFHAEDDTSMLAQFHELARMLGTDDGKDQVAAVHTASAGHPGRWLLVLDNVPDHATASRPNRAGRPRTVRSIPLVRASAIGPPCEQGGPIAEGLSSVFALDQ
jgi:hypothetical protein